MKASKNEELNSIHIQLLKSVMSEALQRPSNWRNLLEYFIKGLHIQDFAMLMMNIQNCSTNNRIWTVNIFEEYVDKLAKCSS